MGGRGVSAHLMQEPGRDLCVQKGNTGIEWPQKQEGMGEAKGAGNEI